MFVDQIRDTPYGLFGEWVFTTRDQQFTYGPIMMGLQDPRSRLDVSRALASRNGNLNWAKALDEFCPYVIREIRRQASAVILARMPRPADPYLLAPILPLGQPTVLYADGATGKSVVALAWALTLSTGQHVAPGLGFLHPSPVLYCDWERSADVHGVRLDELMRGAELLDPGPLYYLRLSRPLPECIGWIRGEAARVKSSLVICDSYGYAAGGEIESSSAAFRYFSALNTLGLTSLTIAHIPHQLREHPGARRPYGSVFVRNSAFVCWEMRKESTDGPLRLGIYQTKPGDGPPLPPFGYEMTFSPQIITLRECEPAGLNGESTLGAKILRVLRRGDMTYQAIAEDLASTEGAIRNEVMELCRAGKVRRIEPKKRGKGGFVLVHLILPGEEEDPNGDDLPG
jgi:hypothetical protein